jgi:drug/metabolite transporter (DMT)-like permease
MPTTPDRRAHARAAWTLVLCALMWSIAGVFTRQLERAEAFEISFWRSAACVATVAIALAWRDGRGWWRPIVASGRVGLLSGAMWAVMFTCFMVALTRTTVANTLVVMALSPLLAALLAWLVLREPVTPRTGAAIATAGAGIVWMVRGGVSAEGLAGMAIALAVPIAAAINIVTLKRIGARVDLVPAVLIGGVLSCLATLPFALPLQAGAHDLAILALLGVLQLGVPCMMMVAASRHLAPHEIALLALLEVVFGPIWAWLGAGEVPAPATLQGGLVVLAALVLNELAPSRARAAPAPAPADHGVR